MSVLIETQNNALDSCVASEKRFLQKIIFFLSNLDEEFGLSNAHVHGVEDVHHDILQVVVEVSD